MSPSEVYSSHIEAGQPQDTNGHSFETGIQNGHSNSKNGFSARSFTLPVQELHDLVCIGLGPASLAIGVALEDFLEQSNTHSSARPKVAFIERQPNFNWHSGMQIPGAKMQISYIKDFATLRNPRSRFTFVNYLHTVGRLERFTNLGTFLPSRVEYQAYMQWCANSFKDQVLYGHEVVQVAPVQSSISGKVEHFLLTSRNVKTGKTTTLYAKKVVVAVGGRPNIPSAFTQAFSTSPNIIHSSRYMEDIHRIVRSDQGSPRIAVVGGGQSAAEIFNDLQTRFPNAKTTLVLRTGALKPSDDSPFVNEIFAPTQTANVFKQNSELRKAAIASNKATNYGVVRLGLLEHIYENLYLQSLHAESRNKHQIFRYRKIFDASTNSAGNILMKCYNDTSRYEKNNTEPLEDVSEFEVVILATGYVRDAHLDIIGPLKHLLPKDLDPENSFGWPVSEDYRVPLDEEKVDSSSAGLWMQGCNESTHGLSDTLLSVLAVRGGEMVQSIFGNKEKIKGATGSEGSFTNGL